MWRILGSSLLLKGALLWSLLQKKNRRLWACQDTVESCGLRVVSALGLVMGLKIEARAGQVTVQIEDIRKRRRGFDIRVMAMFPAPPGFSGVWICREEHRPPEARKIEVGDELFDSKFYVEGPAQLLSVLLDAETRRLLLDMNAEGRLEISDGELRVETFDEHLASLLPNLLYLARRFERVDTAQRLAETARQAPEAGVRLRNLLLLVRELPGDPITAEALRTACSDPSPQVRLRAAMELGAEGRDVLAEVAEGLEDDDSSAQAVARLGRELPFERTRALLGHALRRRRMQTARACLEALGESGDAAAVDMLAKVLAREKGELAPAAALALGATASKSAEPPLLAALQRDAADLQVAAANALARTGTAAAVLPLHEAARRSPKDQELQRATRQAIAEIQSRLDGASPGQLSLAGAEAGQLSLPDTERGQLSLAPDAAGQVSLALPQED